MTGSEKWLQALTEHVRQIEPNDAEVAGILARSALDQPRATQWRRRTSRFNLVLAAFVGLLLMTAIAVASGLVSPGAIVPGGDGGSSSQDEESSRPSFEGVASGGTPGQTGQSITRPRTAKTREFKVTRAQRTPRQAEAAVRRIYQAIRDADVGTVCESMTARGQHQVAISTNKDQGATCEKSLGRYFAFAERDGGLRSTRQARVVGAVAHGNRAIVTVRFPDQATLRRVKLIWDGQAWKLQAMKF